MSKVAVKVAVWESERGWGAKVDDHMVCIDVECANYFISYFNARNNEKSVPDWYMYAEEQSIPMDITDAQYEALDRSEEKRMWLSELKKIK